MTPRALTPGAGLRGSTSQVLTEGWKELGREFGLLEDVYWWKQLPPQDDGGGSYKLRYEKQREPIRGFFQDFKRAKPRGVVASRINEFTEHILTIDIHYEVEPPDRIQKITDGTFWEVLAKQERTEAGTLQLEVKEVEAVENDSQS